MSGLRRVVPHKSVIFVTTSIEEGLMFTANPLIRLIVCSCIARALAHHPIKICDIVVEATHIHFLIVVYNPDDLRGFMERFKTESAFAINGILGRETGTVWCKGYDSTVILDPDKTVEKIAYIYSNPAKDGLVDNIDEFPGFNSWRHFTNGAWETTVPGKLLPRAAYGALPKRNLTQDDYRRFARDISQGMQDLDFELYGIKTWLECFGITDSAEIASYRDRVIAAVRKIEQEFREERAKDKVPVMGAERLKKTRPGTPYRPSRSGKKTYCLSSDISLKVAFIMHVKALIRRGREVLERWREGDLSVPYPPGLYPPNLPRNIYPLDWPGLRMVTE